MTDWPVIDVMFFVTSQRAVLGINAVQGRKVIIMVDTMMASLSFPGGGSEGDHLPGGGAQVR